MRSLHVKARRQQSVAGCLRLARSPHHRHLPCTCRERSPPFQCTTLAQGIYQLLPVVTKKSINQSNKKQVKKKRIIKSLSCFGNNMSKKNTWTLMRGSFASTVVVKTNISIVPQQVQPWNVSRQRTACFRAHLAHASKPFAVCRVWCTVKAVLLVWCRHACPAFE